jgi:hypothetical protein
LYVLQRKMLFYQDYLHCQLQTLKRSTMRNLQLFQKARKLAHLHAQTQDEYNVYFDKKSSKPWLYHWAKSLVVRQSPPPRKNAILYPKWTISSMSISTIKT